MAGSGLFIISIELLDLDRNELGLDGKNNTHCGMRRLDHIPEEKGIIISDSRRLGICGES